LTGSTARLAVNCQRAIATGVSRLFRNELANLEACVQGIFKCAQVKFGDNGCIEPAGTKCTNKLAQIADEQARFIRTSSRKCANLAFDNVLAAGGLGYEALASECETDFGLPLGDRAAISFCVIAKYVSEVARLFDLAGVTLPPGLELPNLGGNGMSFNDADTGRAIVSCSAAIAQRGARPAALHLRDLLNCVEGMFTCIQTKPTDESCQLRAAHLCSTALATIDAEETTPATGVEKRCAETILPFAELLAPAGANLQALATDCLAVDVPALASLGDYELCLVRQYRCGVEDLVRFAAPRADELLRSLVHRPLRSALCPADGPLMHLSSQGPPRR
jgi:hypothetical protein